MLEKDKGAPACRITDKYFSPEDYKQFVDECDIVTFEFEHVYDKTLEYANEKDKLIPSIETIILKRERHREKLHYLKHNFPTPRFLIANDGEEALKIAKDSMASLFQDNSIEALMGKINISCFAIIFLNYKNIFNIF